MQALNSLLPIFFIIALGLLAARFGLFPTKFIKPAANLVFYLGLPFLAFRAVIKSPITDAMVLLPALLGAAAILLHALLALLLAKYYLKVPPVTPARRASWVCSQFHGNMGIMGLAVVYYSVGEEWLGTGALVMAVLMLVHTPLAIGILNFWGDHDGDAQHNWDSLTKNPIIIGIVAGLICALGGVTIPGVVDRTLAILSQMALPLALLIIGAELSMWRPSQGARHIIEVSLMKMMALPAIGLLILHLFNIDGPEAVVTLVMLASPCAAASVILAGKMGGDSRFAAASTSFSHVVCPLFYIFWLELVN
jgi:predicted permease